MGLTTVRSGKGAKDVRESKHREVLKAALRRGQKRLRYLGEILEEGADPEHNEEGYFNQPTGEEGVRETSRAKEGGRMEATQEKVSGPPQSHHLNCLRKPDRGQYLLHGQRIGVERWRILKVLMLS